MPRVTPASAATSICLRGSGPPWSRRWRNAAPTYRSSSPFSAFPSPLSMVRRPSSFPGSFPGSIQPRSRVASLDDAHPPWAEDEHSGNRAEAQEGRKVGEAGRPGGRSPGYTPSFAGPRPHARRPEETDPMEIRTHQQIDPALCGRPVSLAPGRAEVTLEMTPAMAVDAEGLVHGGFVFGAADHAAMLAVNHPHVVLARCRRPVPGAGRGRGAGRRPSAGPRRGAPGRRDGGEAAGGRGGGDGRGADGAHRRSALRGARRPRSRRPAHL